MERESGVGIEHLRRREKASGMEEEGGYVKGGWERKGEEDGRDEKMNLWYNRKGKL